jgi:hypothetical protein
LNDQLVYAVILVPTVVNASPMVVATEDMPAVTATDDSPAQRADHKASAIRHRGLTGDLMT